MLNRIILIGRLTRDPELRFTPNSKAVCSFTLAVDRPFTGADGSREADFINIVVWNKPAESCAQYLSKGKMAAVDGRLQIRAYDDSKGERRWVTEVIAESVRFLSPRNAGQDGGEPWQGGYYRPETRQTSMEDYEPGGVQSTDLPF